MHKPIALLLCVLLTAPGVAAGKGKRDAAEDAYESARRAYYALKDDPKRRSFRHNWLNVAEKFEAVARKHPKSDRAPDALYTAAELKADLSRVSMLQEDLRAAIELYERLIEKYPKDNLADDSALALARIHVDRTGETEKARRVVDRALSELPKGDVRGKLKAILATLPHTPSTRAEGKRIAARTRREAEPEAKTARPEPDARAASSSEARAAREASSSETKPEAREVRGSEAKPDARGTDDSASAVAEQSAAGARGSNQGDEAPSGRDALADAIARASRQGSTYASERTDEEHSSEKRSAKEPDERSARKSEPPSAVSHRSASEDKSDSRAEAASDSPPAARGDHDHDPAHNKRDRKATTRKARKMASVITSTADELTLAEQLGLKVRRVVIDAGHGGHDTGAIGKKGTREKDVALAIARRVGEILADRGLEVILTRDDDTFVRLEDRTRIANEAKGDLFISIHCNASENRKVRGTETFTLNVAADRYSIRLAARENASSEKSVSDLQFILADLATKANTEESQRLAKRVQQSLVSGLKREYSGVRDFGTKQALFYVLLGAKMPAILVETAFISNAEEEKRLASKEFQEHTAQSIADGVQAFLDDRGRIARID